MKEDINRSTEELKNEERHSQKYTAAGLGRATVFATGEYNPKGAVHSAPFIDYDRFFVLIQP